MKNKQILEGIYSFSKNSGGGVWLMPFNREKGFFFLPAGLGYRLPQGARVKFSVQRGKINEVISVCGKKVQEFNRRKNSRTQTVINPQERFNMASSNFPSLRILDLFTPLGMGSRALLISPPRAGKTVLLQQLAIELGENKKVDKLLVLLIDERPEEVTDFIRNTNAVIYHSDLDSSAGNHVRLADLMLKNIDLELECGNNIVVLLDSLTRLARATNRDDRRAGKRVMSGGLGEAALQLPRKLLGKARNIENGGSCTIIATILRDTGSRMDDILFQEFKGTGNCEIILDKDIADERIFPALDIKASGTRKDELLHAAADLTHIQNLRRHVLSNSPQMAILKMLQLLKEHPDNSSLIQAVFPAKI